MHATQALGPENENTKKEMMLQHQLPHAGPPGQGDGGVTPVNLSPRAWASIRTSFSPPILFATHTHSHSPHRRAPLKRRRGAVAPRTAVSVQPPHLRRPPHPPPHAPPSSNSPHLRNCPKTRWQWATTTTGTTTTTTTTTSSSSCPRIKAVRLVR